MSPADLAVLLAGLFMASTVGVGVYAWRARAALNGHLRRGSNADPERLEQLEQTMHDMVEEMRRLREEQSFTTALLSERSPSAQPVSPPPPKT